MRITERVVMFGHRNSLVGLLSRPAGKRPAGAVLIPNAGPFPRTGPFRMATDLSRSFALAGIAALRFDLGGVGDSAAAMVAEEADDAMFWASDDLLAARRATETLIGTVPVCGLLGMGEASRPALLACGEDPAYTHLMLVDPKVGKDRSGALAPGDFGQSVGALLDRDVAVFVRWSGTGPHPGIRLSSAQRAAAERGRLMTDTDLEADILYTVIAARHHLFSRMVHWLIKTPPKGA